MDGTYKGVGRWEGVGVVEVGGQAEGGPSLLLGHRQYCCVLSRRQECTQTTRQTKTAIGTV